MKNSLTIFARLVVVSSLFALAAASASHAAMGDGRNGPQTSGEAVPVNLDRALTDEVVINAIKQCTAGAARDLYSQVFKRSAAGLTVAASARLIDPQTLQDAQNSTKTVYIRPFSSVGDSKARTGVTIQDVNWFYISFPDGTYSAIMTKDGRQESGSLEGFLPIMSFDRRVEEARYDELGNQLSSRTILTNPQIHFPKTGRDPIHLGNSTTGAPTALVINVEKYANCILSVIQSQD